MGPFPHDAPAAVISADNPMGTDGFEFVEYAHPNPEELHACAHCVLSKLRSQSLGKTEQLLRGLTNLLHHEIPRR